MWRQPTAGCYVYCLCLRHVTGVWFRGLGSPLIELVKTTSPLNLTFLVTSCHTHVTPMSHLGCCVTPHDNWEVLKFFLSPNFEKFSKSTLFIYEKKGQSVKLSTNGCNVSVQVDSSLCHKAVGLHINTLFIFHRLVLSFLSYHIHISALVNSSREWGPVHLCEYDLIQELSALSGISIQIFILLYSPYSCDFITLGLVLNGAVVIELYVNKFASTSDMCFY